MNMDTQKDLDSRLEELFEAWFGAMQKNGDTHFTKDGVIYKNHLTKEQSVQEWLKAEKRVVFLLKDQNQKGIEKWDEDIRYWLKDNEGDDVSKLENKRRNRNLESSFIKHIAYILWGVCKAEKEGDWPYEEVVKYEDEVKAFFNTQPFALVECKKQPGGGFLEDSFLKQHLWDYGSFLWREIHNILRPNVIICTGQPIYDFVLKRFPKGELKTIDGHNSIRYHKPSGTIILFTYHPGVFGANADKSSYLSAMDHFWAFLKSDYSTNQVAKL